MIKLCVICGKPFNPKTFDKACAEPPCRETMRERQNECLRKWYKDPANRERQNERRRKWRKDPANRERQNKQRLAQYYQNRILPKSAQTFFQLVELAQIIKQIKTNT